MIAFRIVALAGMAFWLLYEISLLDEALGFL